MSGPTILVADDGSSKLGINLLGYDAEGWPFVH